VRCPICWNPFHRKDVDSGVLSREHVVPTSARKLTSEPNIIGFTCRRCNNIAGSGGHRAMKDYVFAKLVLSSQHEGPVSAIVTFKGVPKQRVEVQLKGGNIEIVGIESQNDPRIIEKIKLHLEQLVESGERVGDSISTSTSEFLLPLLGTDSCTRHTSPCSCNLKASMGTRRLQVQYEIC